MPIANISQRSRGMAAVVLGRPDAPPTGIAPAPPPVDAAGSGWPRWFAVVAAVGLGAAVAGIWALLLFGDSLRR